METITVDILRHPLYADVAVLRIKGFVYANTLNQLEKSLEPVISSERKKVVLDLSETHYVSSGGWSLFLTHVQRLRDAGGNILLACMKPEVYDAFEMMEFHKFLRLFPSVEAAVKDGYHKSADRTPEDSPRAVNPASPA